MSGDYLAALNTALAAPKATGTSRASTQVKDDSGGFAAALAAAGLGQQTPTLAGGTQESTDSSGTQAVTTQPASGQGQSPGTTGQADAVQSDTGSEKEIKRTVLDASPLPGGGGHPAEPDGAQAAAASSQTTMSARATALGVNPGLGVGEPAVEVSFAVPAAVVRDVQSIGLSLNLNAQAPTDGQGTTGPTAPEVAVATAEATAAPGAAGMDGAAGLRLAGNQPVPAVGQAPVVADAPTETATRSGVAPSAGQASAVSTSVSSGSSGIPTGTVGTTMGTVDTAAIPCTGGVAETSAKIAPAATGAAGASGAANDDPAGLPAAGREATTAAVSTPMLDSTVLPASMVVSTQGSGADDQGSLRSQQNGTKPGKGAAEAEPSQGQAGGRLTANSAVVGANGHVSENGNHEGAQHNLGNQSGTAPIRVPGQNGKAGLESGAFTVSLAVAADATNAPVGAAVGLASTTDAVAAHAMTVVAGTVPEAETPGAEWVLHSENATVPRVDVRELVGQLVKRTEVALKGEGPSEMRLRLVPEQLGQLDMKISVDHGLVTARFTVESQAVKGLVEARLPELQQALKEQGLKVEAFSVGCGGEYQQGAASQAFQQEKRPQLRGMGLGRAYAEGVDLQAMASGTGTNGWAPGRGETINALV